MRYALLVLLLLSIVAARQEQIPVHTMDGDPDRPVIADSMPNALDAPIVIEGPKVRQHQQTDLDFLQRIASSQGELEEYAAALAQSDSNIEKITIDSDRTEIFYRQPARLFGVFPVTYRAKAAVQDGQTGVDIPWWLVFASHSADEMRRELAQMSIKQNTIQDRQQTLKVMSSIMKTYHDSPKASIQNMRG